MFKPLFSFAFAMGIAFFAQAQTTIEIDHDGETRSFILYQPANLDEPSPLVFCFHGYTNWADFQMGYSSFNEVADANNFTVIYPEGTPDDLGISHWNSWMAADDVNDVDFISSILDQAIENYNVDPLRVYSCGFSNGGMMSYTLACELSDRFAAVASVAGTMNPALLAVCNPERQVPIMHVHGTLDAVVPINGSAIGELTDFGELLSVASTVEFWNGISSCSSATTFELPNTSILDFSSVSKTVYSDCETGLENWYYEIFAGGHTWPGAFPLVVVGNTNLDINASEEIWDFFSMYTLPEPSVGIEETLEENAKELIACYSLQGKEVEWGVDLPSGIYVLRFSDGSCEKRLLN